MACLINSAGKSGNNPRKHSTIAIRRAIQNAGIEDFRVHDFRHTCASRLVQNGMTVQETAHIFRAFKYRNHHALCTS